MDISFQYSEVELLAEAKKQNYLHGAAILAAGVVILFTLIPLIALRKKGFAVNENDSDQK